MTDDLIVLTVDGGVADVSVAHLPARVRVQVLATGGENVIRFQDVRWPNQWPAGCGVTGLVYNRAGCLADVPTCGECVRVLAGAAASLAGNAAVPASTREAA